MWYLTTCKISVSLLFLKWIKNEMIFYRISELILATLIQRYDKNKQNKTKKKKKKKNKKKQHHFKNERLNEILQVVRRHIL